MDPFTLMKLAGHADLSTTMRYVHLNDDDVRAAIQKSEVAKGGHKTGHNTEDGPSGATPEKPVLH